VGQRVGCDRWFGMMNPADPNALPVSGAAWQPFTFGGVAAFARAGWARLLLVAGLAAMLLGGIALWFVRTAWFPPVRRAIANLPAAAELRGGRLSWPAPGRAKLADTPFLSLAVSVEGLAGPELGGDLQLTLGTTSLRVASLFGYREFPYPRDAAIPLGRTAAEAWWWTWEPYLALGSLGLVAVGVLGVWLALGLALAAPLRVYAALLGRCLTLGGAWRLAVAALLPGALAVGMALAAYILRRLGLAELVLSHALQLLVSVAYLLVAPMRLPAIANSGAAAEAGLGSPTNPFGAGAGGVSRDTATAVPQALRGSPANAGGGGAARGGGRQPAEAPPAGDAPFDASGGEERTLP
jgi:hypothetical protein